MIRRFFPVLTIEEAVQRLKRESTRDREGLLLTSRAWFSEVRRLLTLERERSKLDVNFVMGRILLNGGRIHFSSIYEDLIAISVHFAIVQEEHYGWGLLESRIRRGIIEKELDKTVLVDEPDDVPRRDDDYPSIFGGTTN